MIVNVTTASGARYTFNQHDMTWSRYNANVDVHGLPSANGHNNGLLREWPVLALGHRIMFDDVVNGTVYTTPIISGYTDRP